MANLPETPQWDDGIYQIEVSDPVLGGPDGITNRPLKQLASRTLYLKQKTEEGSSSLAAHIAAVDPHTQYAPKISPVLTGTPTAPTAPQTTNNQQLATTAFVKAALAALVASSPAALDTLNELAAALGNDPNFATTMTNALANKQPLDNTLTALSGKTISGLLEYLQLGEAAKLGVASNSDMQASPGSAELLTTVAAVMSVLPTRTMSSTDYVRIPDKPGGLIIQWGTTPIIPKASWVDVTFPIPFPSSFLSLMAIFKEANSGCIEYRPYSGASLLTGCQIGEGGAAHYSGSNRAIYIAIGQ
ncbi:TPA: phage tail protein [Citrobacter amalonaticus]